MLAGPWAKTPVSHRGFFVSVRHAATDRFEEVASRTPKCFKNFSTSPVTPHSWAIRVTYSPEYSCLALAAFFGFILPEAIATNLLMLYW